MTGYLLDTNVASVLAPGRREKIIDAGVLAWLEGREPSLYLSTMTVMEIETGIQQLARTGSTRRRPELSVWLFGLLQTFGDRVLPFDGEAAMAAGRLEATVLAKGRHPGLADIIIAAIGEVRGLPILTRNLRHFRDLGVSCIDPFKSLPP